MDERGGRSGGGREEGGGRREERRGAYRRVLFASHFQFILAPPYIHTIKI